MSNSSDSNDTARTLKKVLVFAPVSITTATDGAEVVLINHDKTCEITANIGALVGVDDTNYYILKLKQGEVTAGPYTDAAAVQYDPLIPEGDTVVWDRKIDDAGDAGLLHRMNFRFEVDQGFLVPYWDVVGTPTSMLASVTATWHSMSPPEGTNL